MSVEADEITSSYSKVLRFINYRHIVQELSSNRNTLESEFKTLSGQDGMPETFHVSIGDFASPSCIQEKTQNAIKEKLVLVDQRKVIKDLKRGISLLEAEIRRLKESQVGLTSLMHASSPTIITDTSLSIFHSEVSSSLVVSADPECSTADHVKDSEIHLEENNHVEPLQSTDIARNQNQNKIDQLFPSISFVEVETDEEKSLGLIESNDQIQIINIACSGYYNDQGAILTNMLDRHGDLKNKGSPHHVIGVKLDDCSLMPNIKLKVWYLAENERYDSLCEIQYKNKKAHLFLFDFEHGLENSYEICKRRIESCRRLKLNTFAVIGIYRERKSYDDGLRIFNKFRDEENAADSIVCEYSVEGKKRLKAFMLNFLNKHNLNQEVLGSKDESQQEIDENGKCVLQ